MAADYTRVEVTRKIVEFHLETPATLADSDFVRHTALKEFKAQCGEQVYDDSVMIRHDDESIVYFFEYDRTQVIT